VCRAFLASGYTTATSGGTLWGILVAMRLPAPVVGF